MELMKKLNILLSYCKMNDIGIEHSKCKFIVVNGEEVDKVAIPFDNKLLERSDNLDILGGFISENMRDDLKCHIKNRYKNVIKYYNWLKTNKFAPLGVKVKVIVACMSAILHSCETFGNNIPNELEKIYLQLIKGALGARSNTPDNIALIESGMVPLKALITSRQLNFFRKFKSSLKEGSTRLSIFNEMLNMPPPYLKHYINLDTKYRDNRSIYEESIAEMKNDILGKKNMMENYKFWINVQMNPTLTKSPYMLVPGKLAAACIKFRIGSHNLPTETGRWRRLKREERICSNCGVLGNETHYIYINVGKLQEKILSKTTI